MQRKCDNCQSVYNTDERHSATVKIQVTEECGLEDGTWPMGVGTWKFKICPKCFDEDMQYFAGVGESDWKPKEVG